jgi:hypothetical protein
MKLMILGATLAAFAAVAPLSAQARPVIRTGSGTTRQDCTYSRSTNSVGDIIFGRSSNNSTNCVDNTSNRVNGGWYQIGRDNNGATIYERQTRDRNGNPIIQRARRNSNGTLSVISTRNAGNVNGGYNNSTYNNGTYSRNGTYNTRDRENEQGDNDSDHGQWKKDKDYKHHGKAKGHDKNYKYHGKGEGHDKD